ncbi:MAG: ATP-binding protein [Thermodesulfobacteriota bacterium]|nr:ATP-binding protein [Thermodesulfobacteriota bacterium]
MKLPRHVAQIAFSSDFGRQMRFVAGPRQTGKTTIAREFLSSLAAEKLYYNWDNRQVRESYLKNNHFFSADIYNVSPDTDGKRWLCMDEIHKYPDWKNILKDFFDGYHEELHFIITGSARLDMMRKSGDSLAGRYLNFRLNPLTLSELSGLPPTAPPESGQSLLSARLDSPVYKKESLDFLLRYSGFPEPLLSSNDRFFNRWQSAYLDTLIREDLREITQIKNLEKTAALMLLLPERIGSPLSINSLTGDLSCSFQTVANYLSALELGYLIFRISPYVENIARSLKKEKKVYFYDWTRAAGEARCFENYVAMELKSRLDFWQDAGYGDFKLFYIRDRDGRESDFLIVRDSIPWLLLEVKLRRSSIDYQHKKHRVLLGDIPFIQIVREEGIVEKKEPGLYQMSASRFFAG